MIDQNPPPEDPQTRVVRRAAQRERPRHRGLAWAVSAALAGIAGVAALTAGLLGESRAGFEPPSSTPTQLALSTPLLSARRAPEWTTAPLAGRALAEAIAPIAASAPPGSCIGVGNGAWAIYAHNATASLVPASNQKLLIAAAALGILGPDTTLNTAFRVAVAPAGGVLSGDLYMVGGGDPILSTEAYQARYRNGRRPETDLEAVADLLVATGLREVSGSVVGDGSRYDDQRSVPGWRERWLTNGTVAPLSALLVNDAWLINPTTGEGPGGTAGDPAAHAAGVLTQLLIERGVVVSGAPRSDRTPAGTRSLLEAPSLPISALVDELLSFSDNTTAELLLKEIGLAVNGEGSTAAGAAAVTDWAASNGLAVQGSTVVDGSGLSSSNLVTCELLGSILRSEGPDGQLAAGLSVPGQPGTLSDRFSGEEWTLRLRAKTGTLSEVTALSGWLITRPDALLDFQIVINTGDRSVSAADIALQEQILTALLDQPQAPPLEQAGPLPLAES